MKLRLLLLLLGGITAFSFVKTVIKDYDFPSHFPSPVYDFTNNALSDSKVTLGRVLFYDPLLSRDNTISCASCHSPYNAFAHTDHDLSHGIDDKIGTRNAPALFNLAWQRSFMWDAAINHLDMQALAPISHPKEMDENIANLVSKLENSPLYSRLFAAAYQDSTISGEKILKALSMFQLTLVSASSKYDKVKAGTEKFTDQESKGYQLFLENCNSCHSEPLFSNYKLASNGLAVDSSLKDYGKWMISKNSKDSLLFKTPSLRNLSFTYPYMHDGRFKKIRAVINHYTDGIQQNVNIAAQLKSPIIMTATDKTDLLAFLLTLDDKEFVFDKKNKFPREILLSREGLAK